MESIPDAAALESVALLQVFDDAGHLVRFGSLLEQQKTIVVFIRHFFCGSCQAFVTQLSTIRQEALLEADVKLVVIGCGEWQPIKAYKEISGFRGEIYADPSRAVYHSLGMNIETLNRTPKDQPKRSYLPGGFMKNLLSSIFYGPLKNPQHIGKQGNLSQLGGDFIFGPGPVCTFAHRMQHTEDHLEIADLLQKAGVVYP